MTVEQPPRPDPGPLEREVQSVLAAYRGSVQLPPEIKARVRQRLLVAGSAADAEDDEPLPERRSSIARGWWLAAAAIILAGAAAFALADQRQGIVAARHGLDGAAYTADREAPAGAVSPLPGAPALAEGAAASIPGKALAVDPSVLIEADADAHADASDGPSPNPSPDAEKPSPALPGERPTPHANANPHANPHAHDDLKNAPQSPAPTAPASVDLAAEKALLEGAWRALERGDHAQADASLGRHRSEHPAGVLRQEREALEVLLVCERDPAAAQARFQSFRRQHPKSPWNARLTAACGPTAASQP